MLVLTSLCFSKSLLIIDKIYDSYLEDSVVVGTTVCTVHQLSSLN